jgi:hypothetical protein
MPNASTASQALESAGRGGGSSRARRRASRARLEEQRARRASLLAEIAFQGGVLIYAAHERDEASPSGG